MCEKMRTEWERKRETDREKFFIAFRLNSMMQEN